MSVYVRNMKMPCNCVSCPLCHGEYGREYLEKAYCSVKKGIRCNALRRPKECPLVEVKEQA